MAAERFSLERSPFPGGEPDGYFFSTRDLNQRLDLLHHLIQFSDLTLVVSGRRGIGKTTFLHELLGTSRERWRACTVTGATELTPELLIQRLLEGFDLPTRATDDPLTGLEVHLESLHRAQQLALICIDDAHLLPQASQEYVLDLVERWEGFKARILLLKDSDAPATAFDALERVEGLVHRMDLVPLDEEQTGDYIHLRLTRAGLTGDSPFTPQVVRTIYKTSDGLPGTINALADRVIENQRTHGSKRTGGRRIRLVLAVAAAVCACLALGFIAWNKLGAPTFSPTAVTPPAAATSPAGSANGRPGGESAPVVQTESKQVATVTTAGDAPYPAAAGGEPSAPEPTVPTPEPAVPTPEPTVPTPEPTVPTPEPTVPTPEPTVPTPEPAVPTPEPTVPTPEPTVPTPEPTVPTPEPTVPTPEPTVPTPEPTVPTPEPTVPTPEPTVPTPEPTVPTPEPTVPTPEPTVPTPEPTVPTPEPTVPTPEPGPPEAPTTAADSTATSDPAPRAEATLKSMGMRGLDWLRQRERSEYTIQLVGSHDPDSIVRFVRRHELAATAAWFATLHDGRAWYVVVLGTYPSIDAARTAVVDLPYALRRQKPWARSIGGIVDSAIR